jgi:hypothetical protein
LLYLREHMDAEYEEVIDWTEEMERVQLLLGLRRGKFPAPSTLCKVFKRTPMSVWRELLRRSAELLDQSGHAAIDATYFDRQQASAHYVSGQDAPYKRSRRRFWSIPLTERSSTYIVARSGRVGCESVRRSPCGTQATFEASPLTKATTA